ncbi:MAG TPA: DNA-binding domain-containing protein [Polyangiaceae bacterium]|nr:DNA-binding domain-containing protein [Polyangiaceae bacterium]
MTDRLPAPVKGADGAAFVAERASATPSAAVRRFAVVSSPVETPLPVSHSLEGMEAWLVRAITGPESEASRAPSYLTDGPRMNARERLEVYRSGYRARLVECLEDDYRAFSAVVGHEAFHALAEGYIEKFPSSSPSLNYFGRRFPEYVRGVEVPGFPGKGAFFSELAALEWAIVEVIHAETPPPLDGNALRSLKPEDFATAHFEPSEAVRLLRFEHPVNPFFQARWANGDESATVPGIAPSSTAVYRHGMTVWRMDLTPAMTRVLSALLDRVPIAEALGRLGVDETDPSAIAEAERSVMVWFREWVSSGFFARLVT